MQTHQIILRLILATVVGGFIGAERERMNTPAGFRTHILVTVGATLIMLISKYGFKDIAKQPDPARIAAQVVSGIGFLGAGTIFKYQDKVKGLTTAAGLWVCGGLGLGIGAGMYMASLVAAIIVVLALTVLNHWEERMILDEAQRDYYILLIQCQDPGHVVKEVKRQTGTAHMEVTEMKVEKERPEGEGPGLSQVRIKLLTRGSTPIQAVMEGVEKIGGIQSFTCRKKFRN